MVPHRPSGRMIRDSVTWRRDRAPIGSPATARLRRAPRRSGLAGGLEHGGIERLARALAGPDHELEGREIAFAGVERGAEQRLALLAGRWNAAGEHQRMPVHDDAVLHPE